MTQYHVKQGLDRRVLSDFLRVPYTIYAGNSHWVPPITSEVIRTLDVKKNPYFAFARQQRFVCYRYGVPIARMIVVLDPRQRPATGGTTAFFGFFDSIDDTVAVEHLFAAAGNYARSQGATYLEGPFNPNYYSELGIKLDGFDAAPRFFETYNPAYYPELLASAGFIVSKDLKTLRLQQLAGWAVERYGGDTLAPVKAPFSVRQLRMGHLRRDLEEIREVYNDAFAHNPYFHAVSQDEYRFSAKYLRYVTEPRLTTLVEVNGCAVAVTQIMQEVNPLLQRMKGRTSPLRMLRYERDRKKLKSAVIYAIGIKKAYQCSYMTGLLLRRNVKLLQEFDEVSTTWVSEDNPFMLDFCSRLGFVPDRSFAIYRKELSYHA